MTRSPPSPELIISQSEARVAVGAPLPLRLDYGDSRKTALPSQGVLYCTVMVAAFSQTPAVAIDGTVNAYRSIKLYRYSTPQAKHFSTYSTTQPKTTVQKIKYILRASPCPIKSYVTYRTTGETSEHMEHATRETLKRLKHIT